MGVGVVGLAENKANSAPIELELRLSLAIKFDNILLVTIFKACQKCIKIPLPNLTP